ncbi:putative bacterial alpha-L-rhamnosidase C-terminal domain [Lyophyllum shimeji]|uniref:alpha-L-rhamnosidase n=1 Tax=Lyophyllum shimeji TaxID=47721 RepID=A0A9P3PWM7_LYOSH|nr:putative bacterial alpha-L-rhamnosidase C-terminal domain [Lyophyllum shimeji]
MKVKSGTYFLGALCSCFYSVYGAAQVTVSNLQVENKIAPIGIDVKPRFSWIVNSEERGTTQTAYQISVSKSQAGESDVWNSGVIASKQPYLIEYAGPALSSDTRYSWSVNVVTTAGSASASSEFTTGFLSAADWDPSVWIGKPATGLVIPDALASSFRSASWIWTSETGAPNAPAGDRAFRKTFISPSGKTPTSALILMSVDDQFSLYVNGNLVGSSPTTADIWKTSQRFSVALNAGSNLFAVRATNLPDVSTGGDNPAGLLAAIQITFSDGTTTIFSTDSSWRSIRSIPADFQSPSLDDSNWTSSVVIAQYGSGPWGTGVALPSGDVTPTISLTDSTWIWSAEDSPPLAPAQPRAFRKTFQTPSGKTLKSAFIILAVDDAFTLYVNGAVVGSSPSQVDVWKSAQRFTVPLSGSSTVFAVRANNLPDANSAGPSPAGLLAAIQIVYSDSSSTILLSDTTWKVNKDVPTGFELPSTDDSSWSSATSLGKYGVSPWGTQVSISDALGEHPTPLLRKEFEVEKALSFARLYYAVGGYASITLNGAPASDLVLTPGFTKYDTQVQYVVLDVTSKLKVGKNAFGVELGRSHYGVTQGNVWNWNAAPWHAEPSLRTVLSIGYTDGTSAKVVTDASWQVIEGPTRLDDVFGGENFDASYLKPGYDTVGFAATGWSNALVVPGPKGVLVRQRQPPTRVVQSMTPVSITQPVQGIYVVAFERVVAGWAKITVTGPAKTLITIHFGEKLKADGTVAYEDNNHYYANNFQTDRFWLAGTGGPEVFEPKFSYKGYQYVQLEGWPGPSAPTAANIVGQVVHDDLSTRGGFDSSSDLLNKMHKAAVLTMLNNVHSIPEDCPTFEKNGWTGDAMLGTEMFLTNLDAHDLLAKYVRDVAESRPNGSGPPAVIAPDSGWGQNNQAPPWHSAFIFIPSWLYQYRGDRRVLEENYDSMKSYVTFELGRSPNNIASTGLGDWVSPETSPSGGNAPEDNRVSATAYLYKMLTTMSDIAIVLGKSADAATFSSQARNVKTAFNNAFFSNSTGYYVGVGDSGYRQTHNLLALAFGLVPNSTAAQFVADSVSRDVVARGNHLNTGALGTKYLLPILTDYSHADIALAVAQQTTQPSWGFWITNGATSMWEHWALEARSHDHLFLGTFEDWLYKHLAGIQLSSTAFETVSVAPKLTGQLSSARAWTMTPFGNLTVNWANDGGNVRIDVGVPVSVTATVTIPATTGQVIIENGRQLPSQGSREGITVLGSDRNGVRVSVTSGKYSFIVAK